MTLPPGFAALEPYSARWALATTSERHRCRTSSTMAELTEFYEAMTPRIEEALAYLDGFSLEDLPEAEGHLLELCLSLADVALAVEKYGASDLAESSNGFVIDTTALG